MYVHKVCVRVVFLQYYASHRNFVKLNLIVTRLSVLQIIKMAIADVPVELHTQKLNQDNFFIINILDVKKLVVSYHGIRCMFIVKISNA